jgi:predicted small lipoprotein YifL
MTARYVLTATLLLALTACGPATPDDPDAAEEARGDQEVEYRTSDLPEKGSSCIDDDPEYGDLVLVDLELCLSSSCDGLDASCTATVDGDTVTVTVTGETRSRVGEGFACTNDCVNPILSCTIEGDLSGVTTLVYAGTTTRELECPPEIRFEE